VTRWDTGPVGQRMASPEFVGRRGELGVLASALDQATDGHATTVLVGGEAGVGKTAFVREFCNEHDPGARVLWGGCDALFTPGVLGPLLEVAEAVGGEFDELVTSGGVRPH
jgi:MoxR-like ATPase